VVEIYGSRGGGRFRSPGKAGPRKRKRRPPRGVFSFSIGKREGKNKARKKKLIGHRAEGFLASRVEGRLEATMITACSLYHGQGGGKRLEREGERNRFKNPSLHSYLERNRHKSSIGRVARVSKPRNRKGRKGKGPYKKNLQLWVRARVAIEAQGCLYNSEKMIQKGLSSITQKMEKK